METVRFYRGQEDEVVVEKSDFEQSIFREQYVLALQQIDKMLNAPKEKIPSILAFCGDRGEGKSSCMESVRNMLLKKEEENIETKSEETPEEKTERTAGDMNMEEKEDEKA